MKQATLVLSTVVLIGILLTTILLKTHYDRSTVNYDNANFEAIYNNTEDIHPRITIITSLYKGDLFIKGFLEDITRQTIFDQCELLLINAASPGNEDPIIMEYVHKYPNILYIKLKKDPGLYAVWNVGIRLARGEFIANANVDDRLHPRCYETFLTAIVDHPEVDLVYSDFYYSYTPNETFEDNNHMRPARLPNFNREALWRGICLPNNHPLWRKTMNEKYGLFDEWYKIIGDYEMWLRAVAGGARFLRVPGVYGMFYVNPRGLSTNCGNVNRLNEEHYRVNALYKQGRN